jgi:two-component system, LuxR family, sensor kinase FixL
MREKRLPSGARPHGAKQKVAEREVARFQAALGPFVVAAETARMPIVFTNAKQDGNPIVFVNDSFSALFACERDDVLGRDFAFLMAKPHDPDARGRIGAGFICDIAAPVEIECRRGDGQSFLAAVYISPVHDERGDVVQHFLSFVDLAEHDERLRKERKALHTIYQNTPGFIAIAEGPNHFFIFANAAHHQLVGYREIVGRTAVEVLPELIEQGFVRRMDEVYATGIPFVAKMMPIRLQRRPGAEWEQRFVDFILQPTRNEDMEITGIFWEGSDVTDHKRAVQRLLSIQAELIHVSRVSAMGTMATTLAHELNQPLTAISNYAAACRIRLASDGFNKAQLADGLAAIEDNAMRAGAIIRWLRDMTKRGKTKRELFDLSDAVRESVEIVRAGSCDGVRIDNESDGAVMVEADRVQIQQVVMNLAKNGCEAAAGVEDGRVIISTRVEDDRAVVSVGDTGRGIAPDMSARLFEWTLSAKPDGMGIGLSISRAIVEAHEGDIWLEDGREGRTRFCFSVPLDESAGGPGERRPD